MRTHCLGLSDKNMHFCLEKLRSWKVWKTHIVDNQKERNLKYTKNLGPFMKQNKTGHDFNYSWNIQRLTLTWVVSTFPFQLYLHGDVECEENT